MESVGFVKVASEVQGSLRADKTIAQNHLLKSLRPEAPSSHSSALNLVAELSVCTARALVAQHPVSPWSHPLPCSPLTLATRVVTQGAARDFIYFSVFVCEHVYSFLSTKADRLMSIAVYLSF